jgi:hypothetical protein
VSGLQAKFSYKPCHPTEITHLNPTTVKIVVTPLLELDRVSYLNPIEIFGKVKIMKKTLCALENIIRCSVNDVEK